MKDAERGDAERLAGGRELDALVAERVMGQQIALGARVTSDGPILLSDGEYLPCYSTDIAAAWEVVNAMIARGHFPDLDYTSKGWRVGMGRAGDLDAGEDFWVPTYASAEAAPLAICRAALAALASEPHSPE